jgi:hypothetical protein
LALAVVSVALTVDNNVLTIKATRHAPSMQDGVEPVIAERPWGEFTRQVLLGNNLDVTVRDAATNVSARRQPDAVSANDRDVACGDRLLSDATTQPALTDMSVQHIPTRRCCPSHADRATLALTSSTKSLESPLILDPEHHEQRPRGRAC